MTVLGVRKQYLANLFSIIMKLQCLHYIDILKPLSAPLFSPNTLKSPLKCLKFTKKNLGGKPQNPGRSLSSDPGSATASTYTGTYKYLKNTVLIESSVYDFS